MTMVGVNKVILIGNLGKDPDVVSLPQDRRDEGMGIVKKASFTLATTESHKNRDGERIEQTEWHNIVCWRQLAEIASKVLHKGMPVYVEGKLQSRSWEDREGNKKHITEVVADNFTVLGPRNRYDENRPKTEKDPLADLVNDEIPSITNTIGDLPF